MAGLEGKLDQILEQLSAQKEDISQLQMDLRQNSKTVSTEVKKIKERADFSWRKPCNKIQYLFNSEIEETFNQANWAVENQKFEYAQEVIGEGLTKIKQRNKHIKLADSSEGGWETVKQYQSNPLASDSDDKKKLQKAEFRAAQKKRRQEPKSFGKKKFKHGYSDSSNPMQSNVVFPSWSQGATGVGPVGQPIQRAQNQPFRQQPGYSGSKGCCFACWSFMHWRKECPFIRAQQTTSSTTKQ